MRCAISALSFNRPVSSYPIKSSLPVALWILFCAYCNLAGWVLSALHQLNAMGYVAAFLPAAALLPWLRKRFFPARGHSCPQLRASGKQGNDSGPRHPLEVAADRNVRAPLSRRAGHHWRKLKQRFARPFPLAFLALALLAILGGALHAPNNYDALAYLTPRVLHWLAGGRWHWGHA